ncbi:M3 family oligoendopeptidase [Notoacmeibacter sp. MSK16QG-6]|uniref:M3 family oligoendopeptidase n=1 Tax=Notoacmeibacter sp. MSK16QG-6 TaxID=2957982 RepID=UPI0020A233E1|nr:M3 family oligoendopeptidase [Notoacmeibacter sp. MSK16QG-6]MCP1200375.1 M3 family oligoendopeptidase [Notoacmeibacter sp. MSK16QG-6]
MTLIHNAFQKVRSQDAAAAGTYDALGVLPEWDLTDLYRGPDDETLKSDVARSADLAKEFHDRWAGTLADAAGKTGDEGLGAAIEAYEAIEELMGRIMSFAGLYYYGDTSDAGRGKLYGDLAGKITDASSHLLFFPLELNRIDEKVMGEAMDRDARLAHYRPWVEDLRKDRPYQLDDKLEQLFLDKSQTAAGAWNRLYDETQTHLRFEVGEGQMLPLEPALNLLMDADPDVRASAAAGITGTYQANIRTFTLITNTLAKDLEISQRWRGFEDIADGRHLANRVEKDVVDALEEAVVAAYPRLSHRYYAMKAKWLGMDKLNHWDRNAPLPTVARETIGWETARQTVLDAYGGFDPRMADIANDFFEKSWIDAPSRAGKASGAFSHPTVPSAHPYVLLNYQGRPRDVMVLAHELGHGVHQVLAGKQGALMADTPLTLAETASVFGEMLTFRSLLDRTSDPEARKAMLAGKVEDMINTVIRQIAFYRFERKVHTARREGELTSEQIGQFWIEVQGESLGPAVKLNEGYEVWWAYVKHFIASPFYVYAYAFGDCLVNSLYAVYQNASDGFADRYLDMLAAGGTKHHSDLLAPFGLDASDPSFWTKGLAMLEGLIDELEAADKES